MSGVRVYTYYGFSVWSGGKLIHTGDTILIRDIILILLSVLHRLKICRFIELSSLAFRYVD